MTATTISAPRTATARPSARPNALTRAWADTVTITQRNLINVKRNPQLLVFSTIQPVIFVLMFRYVFGGAIPIPRVPYVDYLMPGVFGQTIAFGAISTGIGLAEDMSKGLIERFRSLPMARSAVLVGRSIADLCRNVFVQGLMVGVGFLVGFRIHQGILRFLLAVALMLVFGFALSWIFATIGLLTKNAEATQAAAFPLMAPLVFASTAFVPLAGMPGWLQGWARNQPLSITIAAVRKLTLGPLPPQAEAALGLSGTTSHYVVWSLVWAVGIVAVFAPLAVRRYRRVV
jgi:ABC-2 type transport system permease protein/oleandomycin transport system permease protein